MTGRERITAVIQGLMPDRVPVSLYKIDPFEKDSFWVQHKSFEKLLAFAREYQDTFHLWRPKTGFFFSAPESIEMRVEEFQDTPLSKTVKIYVDTGRGPLVRIARTSTTSVHLWVQKPWIENERDILKFLELPYTPFKPDLSDYYRIDRELGDRGVCVIALPNPLAVIYELFAPGDMPQFILSTPKLIYRLLDEMYKRLVNLYRFISTSVANTIIRIRGAEYGVPPHLPPEYFPDIKKSFSELVLRYDRELIEILKRGNRNYICYHWHGDIEKYLPLILKSGIDILEPVINSVDMPNYILKIRKIIGDNIVIMGGLQAEDMEFRETSEIIAMTKEAIIQGGRKGRFVLIPSGIPESSPISPQMEKNYIQFLKTGVE
ncbi:MAG TPA: uroporphyrinogen decarboxylase family protein, partial [bacterium]|nr:uroporphyrinogen decarboxylase family protein [bacterium]